MVIIGRLTVRGKKMTICVGREKGCSKKAGDFVLTPDDMDYKWICDIYANASTAFSGLIADARNRKYVFLYVIFSTRKKIFFRDLIEIYGLDYLIDNCGQWTDIQQDCLTELKLFMEEKGYDYKILKSNPWIYSQSIGIGQDCYSNKELLSLTGLRLCWISVGRCVKRRMLSWEKRIARVLSMPLLKKELKKRYPEVKVISPVGYSGCLYFRTQDNDGKEYFIKAAALWGSDIYDEYVITKTITDKFCLQDKFLFPFHPESSEKILVFPFEHKIALSDVLSHRGLQHQEIELLMEFLVDVLTELKKMETVHRDLRPNNILVSLDSSGLITDYELIDFGCACFVDDALMCADSRKERYAGSVIRYAEDAWNDSASALCMLVQLLPDSKPFRKKIDIIKASFYDDFTVCL